MTFSSRFLCSLCNFDNLATLFVKLIFIWYFVLLQEHINLIVGLVTQLGGDLKMGR